MYEKTEKSGVFYVRYRIARTDGAIGKLVRKKVGTRQQAIDYLNKVRHLKASGDGAVPTTARKPARTYVEEAKDVGNITLDSMCDALVDHIEANPAAYRDQQGPPSRIGRIKKDFEGQIAKAIKSHEIETWLKGLKVKPATKNLYKTMFSSIYIFAAKKDPTLMNPCKHVETQAVGDLLIRYMDENEEVRLRKVLQADVDEEMRNGTKLWRSASYITSMSLM